MKTEKTTFAIFLGNRGFFPASLMDQARTQLPKVLKKLGHKTILMDAAATRHGAVETPAEGHLFAEFLRKNRGKFGGIIVSLPNFGDETGAVEALKEAEVPIFIQAYPDELSKMAPEVRRDSFCGKFSIMDMFYQYGIKFTAFKPHTVDPESEAFAENIRQFDSVCRVVNGLKGMVVGAIGARTTAFKTVRIDEVALQRCGITMETLDLSHVFARMEKIKKDEAYKAKQQALRLCADWKGIPAAAEDKIVRAGVVIDQLIEEYQMDAMAIRCWVEFQQLLGISPCVLMGELNDRGVAAACEVDIGNAVAMHILKCAAAAPATCLDWNNNYADEENKCILFHCGPVPRSLMVGKKGRIEDHLIIANSVGKGCGYGCNVGRIAPMDFTFASMMTWQGKPRFYLGDGEFTADPIPPEFFGCAGVAKIPQLQDVLLYVGKNGYRHHVSAAPGHVVPSIREALTNYLGFEVAVPQDR